MGSTEIHVNPTKRTFMKHLAGTFGGKGNFSWLLILALLSPVCNSGASTYSLVDGNSSVSIDPGSQTGMNGWTVDGNNQLNQQWFWYRVGSGTAASIDTISAPVVSQPNARTLVTTYANSQFSVQAVYSLVGGAAGSQTSDLGEQIKIQNLSGSPLAFHFFQYADFNTGGANNSIVQLGRNLRGLFNEASVSSGSIAVSENLDTALSPGANRGEAAFFSSTKDALNGTPNYMLNNNTAIGPGHGTWAFEWDPTIAANGTLIISKDLNLTDVLPVPEPPAWSLISMGLVALGVVKHFRARGK
jgi:hypothetical protein